MVNHNKKPDFGKMKEFQIGSNTKSRHLVTFLKKSSQIKSDLFMHNHEKHV